MTNLDLQKPLETMKTLMALQASTMNKSVELQKASGEQLASFFKTEMEKQKTLKHLKIWLSLMSLQTKAYSI